DHKCGVPPTGEWIAAEDDVPTIPKPEIGRRLPEVGFDGDWPRLCSFWDSHFQQVIFNRNQFAHGTTCEGDREGLVKIVAPNGGYFPCESIFVVDGVDVWLTDLHFKFMLQGISIGKNDTHLVGDV